MDSTKELREKLLIKKKNGGRELSEEELQSAEEFSKGYKVFLDEGKTEREAISFAIQEAKEKGFEEFNKEKEYKAGDRIYCVNKEKFLILAIIGESGPENGINMAIAHVDSPRVDLKPRPLYEDSEMAMFKTHYYGGIKKYQWTAMPLSMHGKVVKADGSHVDIKLGEKPDEPCFCITDLLPHLAKAQMGKKMSEAITGENLNVVAGSYPLRGDEEKDSVKLNIMKLINEKYGITEEDFISAEIEMVPAYKAQDIGFDKSLIGAYGHDDRSCAYPCARAIMDFNGVPKNTIMTVLVDKEEIGSEGNTGMKSLFLKYFIGDLASKYGVKGRDVLRKSKCLSADVNAAFDPNYSGEYEAANSCYINRGAVITKYTGSGGKSGTSDASAEFMGEIRNKLNAENVLWQTGQLGKVDAGGGGTIAKYVANLCVDVVDMGIPVLSMHSPFEVVSKIDLYMLYRAVVAFFK